MDMIAEDAIVDPHIWDVMRPRPWWFSRPTPMGMETVPSWHGVIQKSDDEASAFATVDLICMYAAFLRPTIMVESGTYHGHVPFALAAMYQQMRHSGFIYTADPVDCGVVRTMAQAPYLAQHIRWHQCDYAEMLKDVPDPIGMAYIDGGDRQDAHMRLRHAEATYERLAPGAIMFVDDTSSVDWPDAKVFRGWADIYLSQHRGLTIIQKKDTTCHSK